jgi:hypothetical protein
MPGAAPDKSEVPILRGGNAPRAFLLPKVFLATAADEIVAWLEQSGALWVDDKLTNSCMLVDSGEERHAQQCVWADTNADFGPKSSVSDADPGDYLT